MLLRLVSERWEEKACSDILIEGDHDYFGYVLDFVRDGTVCLPASLLKIAFLEDFPEDVIVEMDPFLVGRTVLATREHIDGFHKRIIEGDLQKKLDEAALQLNAAVVAHSIMNCYTQTSKLTLKWEPTGKVREVLVKSRKDEDFWTYCNGFLKDFGLSAKLGYWGVCQDYVDLELELLSE